MISEVVYLSISFLSIEVLNVKCDVYKGEHFPHNYLAIDDDLPTEADLSIYLEKMMKITDYFLDIANSSDINIALGNFLAKSIMKRTLQDYSEKLYKYKDRIKSIINKSSSVVSHYLYTLIVTADEEVLRTAKLMIDDTAHVYSISKFNRNIIRQFILRPGSINEFVSLMDTLQLPKEKYVQLVEDADNYEINPNNADYCLTLLMDNIDPYDVTSLRHCDLDEFCKEKIFLAPSVAYSLSHRLFNNLLYAHNRRCYIYSPEYDQMHMDMLCAEMYREAVYLARRGFFYRDLFMEHIGFCGMLGYEEVHRPRWFRKVASWVDEDGCIAEVRNFELNRTSSLVQRYSHDPKRIKQFRKFFCERMVDGCHHHQMAVAMMVFANAIRHAAHYMKEDVYDKEL